MQRRIIKLLNNLDSKNKKKVTMSVKKLNRIMFLKDWDWEEIVQIPPRLKMTQHHNPKVDNEDSQSFGFPTIEYMIGTVFDNSPDESFANTLESIQGYFRKHHYITFKQWMVVKKSYINASEDPYERN